MYNPKLQVALYKIAGMFKSAAASSSIDDVISDEDRRRKRLAVTSDPKEKSDKEQDNGPTYNYWDSVKDLFSHRSIFLPRNWSR